MSHQQWIQKQEAQWQRLDTLVSKAKQSKVLLSDEELREMALLYRSTINHLSRAQTYPELQHLEPYLNTLIHRCHGEIYERPPARFSNVRDFFLKEFPNCFRKHFSYIFMAFLLFALGGIIAALTIHFNPATETFFVPAPTIAELDRGVLWTDHIGANPAESSFLMTNNIRVAFNAFAFGVFLGVGTLILMFHNGLFAFGGPLTVCFKHGMGLRLLSFVSAHGVIELSTIFIAGGAGMLIGMAMLFPGPQSRWQAMKERGREACTLILGCVPLLVIAGLIEGLVSLNRHVDNQTRLIVAGASALSLIVYLGFTGRSKPQVKLL